MVRACLVKLSVVIGICVCFPLVSVANMSSVVPFISESIVIGQLLDTSDFPERWHCGNWTPFHGWTHILSDFFVWLAYTSIPIA
jgi:hypothetical protein